jgi:hypothetical protein
LYNQMRLYKNSLKLVKSKIKKDWYIIYRKWWFESLYNLSDFLNSMIDKGYYEFDFWEKKYKLNNISQIEKLLKWWIDMKIIYTRYSKSLYSFFKNKIFLWG